MVDSKPTWKLDADPNRQATDPLRGYMYQAWQALHAWLELRDDQVLYLEGAEDFDILDPQSGIPVQIKDTCGNITLRTESVTDAIASFWRLRQTHPGKTIKFTYLTRSTIGTEQRNPFGKGNKGLAVWQECRGNENIVKKLAEFLRDDAVVAQRLPTDLFEFLKIAESSDIYDCLISPMQWLTEAPPVEAVTAAIDRKLITYGDKLGVSPSECTKVADRLLREVLTVASRKEYGDRQLDYARFALIFEEVTSVRISRRNLQQLQAIQGIGAQMVAGLPSGMPVSFQPLVHVLSPGLPPPLPPEVAPRQTLVEGCQAILKRDGILFITASTGMGKTTLAKLTARAQGGDWAWFTFSPFHGERFTWALAQVSLLIDDLPHSCNVVLDDLPFEPGAVSEWEQVFAGLTYTVKARQISAVTTSRKNVPSRVRNLLGSLIPSEFLVPDFDEYEIEQLCLQIGCPTEQAKIQTKVAYLHTSGHPQLVHARLLTLSRQGWPTASVDSMLKTPEDVREQQQQARQLLDALAPEETDLLYRASVALAPFRREHIVLLGENANLSRPGDLFDRLVGPWIERAPGNRFALSPLLKNAGTEVWSRSTIEGIHSQLADAILTANELSITESSHALLHAFVGKNKQALAGLGISLVTKASEEVQKALGEIAFWFLWVRVEEKSGPIFEGDQPLSLLLRMMQFRLCVAAEPKKADRVLDAWEREITQLDQSPGSLLSKMLFYISGLLYVQAPIPLCRVVRLFKDFAVVRKAMMTSGCRELFDSLPLTQIDREGVAVNIMATLFGMNGMRCRSMEDLDGCLQGLSELTDELRQELLGAFDMPEGYASVYVDGAFLNEFKAEKPDWNVCLSVLSNAMDCATVWESPSLGASAARTSSIILDEHLDRRDDALAILDEAAKRFSSHSWIVEEQRGTILLHAERYDEAVAVFVRALEGRDDGQLGILHAPFFVFRNAGIAAAGADRWDLAAEFFQRGHQCAVALNDSVFAAAFQTDAAYAFWEAENYQAMLESFRNSIALIDVMERNKSDIGQFWVFRVTAHTLSWIRSVVEDDQPPHELSKPFAGMCSNPKRNEEILTLPDVPFELTLYFLIQLEQSLKAEPLALAKYGARLDEMEVPAVAMFMKKLRIQEAFSSGPLGRLPDLIDKMVRAYVASKTVIANGKPPWSTSDQLVSEEQVRQTLLDEDFLDGPFLAALLLSCVAGTSSTCSKYIEQWRSSAATLSWAEELVMYLDTAEVLKRSSVPELRIVLRSNEDSPRERQLASLFLSQRPSDVGFPDLLQAHVFLLDRFSQYSFWGQYVEETLSEMIASAWAQKAQARFALRAPNVTGPALEAACSMEPECFSKSAAILLAAADATGIRLPQLLVGRYRQLRDTIAEGAQT